MNIFILDEDRNVGTPEESKVFGCVVVKSK